MRGLAWALLLTGCSFEVPAIGHGPGNYDPTRPPQGDPPGTSSVPPTLDPPMFAEPPPMLDGGAPPTAPQSHQIGDPCDGKNASCGAGLQCLTRTAFGTPIPGGYCSTDCDGGCPNGSQCSTQWGPLKLCLSTCPATGCRNGYVCCTKYYNPGVCLPAFLCQ
jgi:hypothetical protein